MFRNLVIFLFFALAVSSFDILTAKPLVAYKSDSLWHFLDDKGKELFEPKPYDNVMGYSEGLFRVNLKEGDKKVWAFINLKGDMIAKLDCDFAGNFSNGYALIYKIINSNEEGKKFTFLNKNGKLLSDYIYDDATEFSEGMAFVMNSKFRGYIDTNGKQVFSLDNLASNCFKEGYADINNMDFQVGFCNSKGEKVIDFQYDETAGFSEGLASVGVNGKYGYINKQGEMIIRPSFDYANPFKEGRAFVAESDDKFNPLWALLDSTGEMLQSFQYSRIQDFSEGTAPVLKDKRWGFIDRNGNYVIKPKYYYCESFVDGLGWVADREASVFGFINKKEELIIPIPKAEQIIDLRINRALYQ